MCEKLLKRIWNFFYPAPNWVIYICITISFLVFCGSYIKLIFYTEDKTENLISGCVASFCGFCSMFALVFFLLFLIIRSEYNFQKNSFEKFCELLQCYPEIEVILKTSSEEVSKLLNTGFFKFFARLEDETIYIDLVLLDNYKIKNFYQYDTFSSFINYFSI